MFTFAIFLTLFNYKRGQKTHFRCTQLYGNLWKHLQTGKNPKRETRYNLYDTILLSTLPTTRFTRCLLSRALSSSQTHGVRLQDSRRRSFQHRIHFRRVKVAKKFGDFCESATDALQYAIQLAPITPVCVSRSINTRDTSLGIFNRLDTPVQWWTIRLSGF